jgi:N-dimethylarginine dimethylaminohydrolase
LKRILVCDPSFYQINYEINPWMNVKKKANESLALNQWNNLTLVIQSLGVKLLKMPPVQKLPDIVFTANAGFSFKEKVVLSNFKYDQRRPEKEYYENYLNKNNITTISLPNNILFEGAGDCLFNENYIFMGYGFRSEISAYKEKIWDEFNLERIFLKLIDPYFYHLDTCFCPLQQNQILINAKAFEEKTIQLLKEKFELIDVPEQDAKQFACNAVVIDKNVIIPSGCFETKNKLESKGYRVFDVDMSEFIKAGGACKCLTLLV